MSTENRAVVRIFSWYVTCKWIWKVLRAVAAAQHVHMGHSTHCGPPGTMGGQGRVDDNKNSKNL